MIAATRRARQLLIAELLEQHVVRSQGELADLLAAEGFTVTQATLSRDLVDIGAVKVRGESGIAYAVPGQVASPPDRDARLRRVCADLLTAATASANLVVLRTPPGGANLLASAIDQALPDDVLGTIAGDDTVLVIASSVRTAPAVAAAFLRLADPTIQEDHQ